MAVGLRRLHSARSSFESSPEPVSSARSRASFPSYFRWTIERGSGLSLSRMSHLDRVHLDPCRPYVIPVPWKPRLTFVPLCFNWHLTSARPATQLLTRAGSSAVRRVPGQYALYNPAASSGQASVRLHVRTLRLGLPPTLPEGVKSLCNPDPKSFSRSI